MEKWGTINIRGIVIASAWKQNGEISAVAIAGYDEIRYRIVDDHLGAQPRALIKKRIVIDGFIETENKNLVVHIRHFRIDTSDTAKAANPANGQDSSKMQQGLDPASRR